MKTPSVPVQLIVGLGNPGSEYSGTRHNAGQDFVENLARDFHAPLGTQSKFFGSFSKISVNGKDVKLLVPTTFMNRSGMAVAAVANFFKIPAEAILVAHDELDLPCGVARLKIGGGHGGHNGLRDIISALGNNKNFGRLRIGIDHPGNAKLVSNYVLKKAAKAEQIKIEDALQASQNHTPKLIAGEWEAAMRELHSSN